MKSKNLSENILKSVKSKGFNYIELDSVIETNHIVERSGESFRRFIFSFNDQNGNELCLRPDLTIASCLKYLNDKAKGTKKVFYNGQAFRKTLNRTDPIIRNQIGFEIIGSKKEKEDDKKIIETAIKSLSKIKYNSGSLTIGNVEIFKLLLNKLDIPKRWRLRLQRHFWRENYFNELLKRLETNSDVDPTIVEIDKKRYQQMLKQAQYKMIVGRSVNEILERFNNKIKDPRRAKKGKNVAKIIKEFLKINCSIDQAAKKLNYFFKKNNINLRVESNYFPITKNKVSKLNVRYSASFGRQLEYYTGLVFKIEIKKKSKNINIINGGRYDNLIGDLGSNKKIPAVGAAINLND
ncbi:ATP phosphoribosyltransferase regulatory subunit [Candidatus Pelagibacter sp.]|nr:ATP phosphoribosyltransferase regulatory subunit [Candidatus Pelagibacter sp.]